MFFILTKEKFNYLRYFSRNFLHWNFEKNNLRLLNMDFFNRKRVTSTNPVAGADNIGRTK